jgi:hypothetical protein
MHPLIFVLALAAQDPAEPPQASPGEVAATAAAAAVAAEPAQAQAPPVVEDRLPTGAPREDYPFVGWCYGALRGYLDLHDQVMPEVTRIESTFRRPGSSLADDLKVYADMQTEGRGQLKLFQTALTAAEKASLRPINIQGAAAVRQGRMVWRNAAEVSKARLAQEWMSWTLPARCETVAARLEARSNLMGATLSANQAPPPIEPPVQEPAPAAAPTEEAPIPAPEAAAPETPAEAPAPAG